MQSGAATRQYVARYPDGGADRTPLGDRLHRETNEAFWSAFRSLRERRRRRAADGDGGEAAHGGGAAAGRIVQGFGALLGGSLPPPPPQGGGDDGGALVEGEDDGGDTFWSGWERYQLVSDLVQHRGYFEGDGDAPGRGETAGCAEVGHAAAAVGRVAPAAVTAAFPVAG